MVNTDWMEKAACTNHPEIDFTPSEKNSLGPAKRVCWGECPVRVQCFRFAVEGPASPELGIWGGHTSREVLAVRAAEGRKYGAEPEQRVA